MMAEHPGSKALHLRLDQCIREALPYLAECAESLKVKVHEISARTGHTFTRVQIEVGLMGGDQLLATAEDGDELTAADLAFEQLELKVSLHKRGLAALLNRADPIRYRPEASDRGETPRSPEELRLLN